MDAVSSDATVPLNCMGRAGEGRGGGHKRWGLSVWRRACCLTHVCILVNGQSACCHLEHTGLSNENHVLKGEGQIHRGTDTPGYRHTGVQTHWGTDTNAHTTSPPIDAIETHLEWNAMDWNVVLATTPHLVQLFLEHFPLVLAGMPNGSLECMPVVHLSCLR